MKRLLIGLLLFQSILVVAQKDNPFKAIDKHALKASATIENDIQALTDYLIQAAETDLEKVRSIYTWLTNRIQYDKQAYKNGLRRINKNNADILRRKKAVCYGYSTLFKEMCTRANLRSEVVSGYSKGTLTSKPDLEKPDHAWNAVEIDSTWYILDATWGSSTLNQSNDFIQSAKEGYFLTSPDQFIINHLPADPMWQLLECPIPPALFQQPADTIITHVRNAKPCFSYQDSITQFIELSLTEQLLKEAINTYSYLPTESNKKELGHAYIDKAGVLSEKTEALQQDNNFEALIFLQEEIIVLCRKAKAATTLYNWQDELFINTLINQAVATSRYLESITAKNDVLKAYDQILAYLYESQVLIAELPNTYFKSYAQESTSSFLEITQQNLAIYKGKK